MEYTGTTALVTGASSGIGAEFARQLAGRGADVVLVGRRAEALEALAHEVRSRTGRCAHPLVLDLSGAESAAALRREVSALGLHMDTVVNCAGMGLTRDFRDSVVGEVRDQVRVNALTPVEITHAFLPDLLASGRGALVNIGSLTGYMPVPGMAVYSAAKSMLIRFTEALAHEVRDSGLTVLAVSPGPTRSKFFERSGTSAAGTRFQTPQQVVTTTLRALDRQHPPVSIISGPTNRFARRVISLLPTRFALRAMQTRPAH